MLNGQLTLIKQSTENNKSGWDDLKEGYQQRIQKYEELFANGSYQTQKLEDDLNEARAERDENIMKI